VIVFHIVGFSAKEAKPERIAVGPCDLADTLSGKGSGDGRDGRIDAAGGSSEITVNFVRILKPVLASPCRIECSPRRAQSKREVCLQEPQVGYRSHRCAHLCTFCFDLLSHQHAGEQVHEVVTTASACINAGSPFGSR